MNETYNCVQTQQKMKKYLRETNFCYYICNASHSDPRTGEAGGRLRMHLHKDAVSRAKHPKTAS